MRDSPSQPSERHRALWAKASELTIPAPGKARPPTYSAHQISLAEHRRLKRAKDAAGEVAMLDEQDDELSPKELTQAAR
jgi:hypothetical protein